MKQLASLFITAVLALACLGCQRGSEVTDPGTASAAGSPQFRIVLPTIPTPQNVAATVSGHTAVITWDAVVGAEEYNIVIENNGSVVLDQIAGGSSFTSPELPAGTYDVKVRLWTYQGETSAGDWSAAASFSIVDTPVYTAMLSCWRPPVSLARKEFKSGSTLPVKFIVVNTEGNPVTSAAEIIVTVGSVSAPASIDNASTGQWKAEIPLEGKGEQTVSLSGSIAPASMTINVR